MKAEEKVNFVGYERSDPAVKPVIIAVLAILISVAACFAVAALMYRRPADQKRTAAPETLFQHGVVEESTITRDWRVEDALVHEHLATYGWSDRGEGIAHIPVHRAMDIFVQREIKPAAATPR